MWQSWCRQLKENTFNEIKTSFVSSFHSRLLRLFFLLFMFAQSSENQIEYVLLHWIVSHYNRNSGYAGGFF